MNWAILLWVLLGLVGLGILFGVITLILRFTGGYAPGWQVRCKLCGRTRDAGEAGLVRIKAASIGKRTIGWCSNCRRLRILLIERKPEAQTSEV